MNINSHLKLENICVNFDTFSVKYIDFELEKGKFLVLLGPSGSGKTTIIQTICGIQNPTSGKIRLNGVDITNLQSSKRNMGMVFQDFALFPHLNVYENIAFGLRVKKMRKKEIAKRVAKLLEIVDLKGYEKRSIENLSGGEKQRVALARTLAPQPEIILFDEPLSALDESLRVHLREKIKEIQKKLQFTAIYVTHDQQEAFYLADKIGVMSNGCLLQIGTPEKIYTSPNQLKVAEFIGIKNRYEVEVVDKHNKFLVAKLDDFRISFPDKGHFELGEKVILLLKSEAGLLNTDSFGVNTFPVSIEDYKIYAGKIEFNLKFGNHRLLYYSYRSYWKQDFEGKQLYLHIPLNSISAVRVEEDFVNSEVASGVD